MFSRQSRDTVVANIAQQGSALLLFLAIPNLLSVGQYAEVVFVGVVLSFTRFCDLGLSSVYGREMPRHYALNNAEEITLWNRTIFWFGALGGVVAGGIAAIVMYGRFGALADAALVALLPFLVIVTSVYVSMASVRGDFRAYRNSQIGLSLSRLIAIPFVLMSGLLGWLAAQAVSLGLVVAGLGTAWIPRPLGIDWSVVKKYLPASMQLALISLLWAQLLDSGRLLASIYYPPQGIAIYGLLTTGYQSIYSLVISAYLPVTVKTLGMLGKSDRETAEYVFDVIHRSLPIVFVMAIAAAELSPWFLTIMFPKYRIDPVMPQSILYGLTVLPFVATLGNLFIGKHRNMAYLTILVVTLAATAGLEHALRSEIGIRAAAVSQAFGTFMLAALLLIVGRHLFDEVFKETRGRIRSAVVRLGALWAVYLTVKILLSWL